MAEQKTYYVLSPGVNIFNDPTQEDGLKTLYPKQALQLAKTARVKKWLGTGALMVIEEKEANKINAERNKGKNEAKKVADAKKKEFEESVVGENQELQKQVDALTKQSKAKDQEIAELKKQIEDGGDIMTEVDNEGDIPAELLEQYKAVVGKDAEEDVTAEDLETEIRLVVSDEYLKVIGEAAQEDMPIEDMQKAIEEKKGK